MVTVEHLFVGLSYFEIREAEAALFWVLDHMLE
jgi:hypothetical protein